MVAPCAIDVEVLVRCSPVNAPLSRTDEQLLTDDASERLSKLRKRKMEAEAEGEPRPKRQRFTYLKATPNERAFGKVFLNVFIVCFNADKRKKKIITDRRIVAARRILPLPRYHNGSRFVLRCLRHKATGQLFEEFQTNGTGSRLITAIDFS